MVSEVKDPMGGGVIEFLRTRNGRWVAVAFVAVSLGLAAWLARRGNGPSDAAVNANVRIFVCSATSKPFDYALKGGDSIPVVSPFSGQRTGYPAELCYWTADGKVKTEPTAVLLNSSLGKPEPTFCPNCGRLVVPHNERPQPGATAPPTEQEYQRSSGER